MNNLQEQAIATSQRYKSTKMRPNDNGGADIRPTLKQPDDSSIRHIALTHGKIAVVDAADYDWLMQWFWCACFNKKSKSWRAERRQKHEGKQYSVFMHRAIMQTQHGSQIDGLQIDHRDGDPLNNRRSNLRLATHQQNQRNQGLRISSKSGFKGVTWHKRDRKWRACMTLDNRHVHLGYFDDPVKASEAYAAAATKAHGEFLRLK